MLRWVKSYLFKFNWKARVSLNGTLSQEVLLRQGVPQGGCMSPTLFLVFIDDLEAALPRGVRAALYAGDLVLTLVY